MKVILKIILILGSLISSAQMFIDDNSESFLSSTSSKIPIELILFNFHPTISIDSIKEKKIVFKRWYKVSLFEIGYGGSSYKSDLTNNIQNGGIISSSILNVNIGFENLKGLGFGTKLGEFFDIQNTIGINSYFPIYTYFPIYVSNKGHLYNEGNSYKIPSMITFYLGGSVWCSTSDTFRLHNSAFLAKNFFRFGINYMFYNYSIEANPIGNGNFSLDTGVLFYQNRNGKENSIITISVIYTFAGIAIKTIK